MMERWMYLIRYVQVQTAVVKTEHKTPVQNWQCSQICARWRVAATAQGNWYWFYSWVKICTIACKVTHLHVDVAWSCYAEGQVQVIWGLINLLAEIVLLYYTQSVWYWDVEILSFHPELSIHNAVVLVAKFSTKVVRLQMMVLPKTAFYQWMRWKGRENKTCYLFWDGRIGYSDFPLILD